MLFIPFRSRPGLTLFLGAFLLYAIVPTRVFYWDGVSFALDIEKSGPELWQWSLAHPNHLLYTVVANAVFRLTGAVGVHTRALFVMQTVNAALAACTVLVLYRVLCRRTQDGHLAFWLAAGFAVCATWWKYATDANAYIAAVLLLIVTFDLLESNRPRTLSAAVTHAAAMLMHQLALLFLPAALWLLCRHSIRAAGMYVAVAASVVLGAYAVVWSQVEPAATFAQWITYHSPDSAFSFDLLRNLLLSLQSSVRLIAGGKLSAVIPNLRGLAGVAVLAGAAWLLRRPPGDAPSPSHRAHTRALVIWIATYALFLWFWLPRNTFYRLFYLPPLILLAAHAGPLLRRALPAIVLALAAWNWTFLIYPQSRPEANAPLFFALQHASTWPPGTAVAYARFHPDLWTISYFGPQVSWIGMERSQPADWEAKRQELQRLGMTMWLDDSAWEALRSDPAGQQWLNTHVDSGGSLRWRHRGGTIRFYRIR